MSAQQQHHSPLNNNRILMQVFNDAVNKHRDKPAFTCMGKSLTFGDVDRLSGQFASYLQNHVGLQTGDRIALQLPNVLQYPVALYGALRAGLVIVSTNPLYTAREIKHQLLDSGAKALVVLSNIAKAAADVAEETNVEHVIVTDVGDLLSAPKRLLVNTVVKHVKKLVPPFSFKNQTSFLKALNLGKSSPFTEISRNVDDVAVLQYTGGTTGVAKGVMLTHFNLVSNMEQLLSHLGDDVREGKEVFVAPLPLYHIYAFTLHCMALFVAGSRSILIPNPRDLGSFASALKGEKVTGFVGINTLFNALSRDEQFKTLDFSQLRVTASGGMALNSDVAHLWESVTGVLPAEGFGMTETSPVVASSTLSASKIGTVGKPVPGTEIKIIDEEGKELAQGEAGELCVRGPQVMKGYWQRPEATAEVLDDEGWLRTGDMVVVDEEGYLKIVDRKKDMIIVSGFNVYPTEIEDVVSQHQDIIECVVVGVPDDETGEAVKLFVVTNNSELNKDVIRTFCRENLTAYKIPRHVEFRDELPKSNVGKILRRELVDS